MAAPDKRPTDADVFEAACGVVEDWLQNPVPQPLTQLDNVRRLYADNHQRRAWELLTALVLLMHKDT